MKDICCREDLEFLMREFYNSLLQNDLMKRVFIEIAKIDLEAHLPHIVDFWEQNILQTGNYRKNVLEIHRNLNKLEKLTPDYFKIWLDTFFATVDRHFFGEKAEQIKTRALSIATVMLLKMQ